MINIDRVKEEDLNELELDPEAIDALADQAHEYVRNHELPSLQLALSRNGRLALTVACGKAKTDDGVRVAGHDTLYAGFSTTKAVVASAVWLLVQQGRLDVQRRVAEIVPEFGANGKTGVSVEHLLMHTAGFPAAPFQVSDWDDREKRLARFASWRLDWEPGSRFVYHPTSAMWAIAEIIERCTSMDFREFIRSHITVPLGLDNLYLGLPRGLEDRVANVEFVGTVRDTDDPASRKIQPPVAGTEETLTALYNSTAFRAGGIPGGGGIMTATDLAMFYQALLDGGSAAKEPIWTHTTLDWARKVRSGKMIDPMTGQSANRALGIVVAGGKERIFRGFARDNSEQAFGHMGIGGQVGWADPQTGLSFEFLTNGHDRDVWRAGLRAITMSTKAVACVAPTT